MAFLRVVNIWLLIFVVIVCARGIYEGVMRTPRQVSDPTYGPFDVWMGLTLLVVALVALAYPALNGK